MTDFKDDTVLLGIHPRLDPDRDDGSWNSRTEKVQRKADEMTNPETVNVNINILSAVQKAIEELAGQVKIMPGGLVNSILIGFINQIIDRISPEIQNEIKEINELIETKALRWQKLVEGDQ